MRNLGSGTYFPRVYDFFPKTSRGHGAQDRHKKVLNAAGTELVASHLRSNPLCVEPTCELVSRTGRGQQHHNQAQNRKDWEESVGLRRTSRANKSAQHGVRVAAVAALDPKDFASKVEVTL